jgi:hypothetical protein
MNMKERIKRDAASSLEILTRTGDLPSTKNTRKRLLRIALHDGTATDVDRIYDQLENASVEARVTSWQEDEMMKSLKVIADEFKQQSGLKSPEPRQASGSGFSMWNPGIPGDQALASNVQALINEVSADIILFDAGNEEKIGVKGEKISMYAAHCQDLDDSLEEALNEEENTAAATAATAAAVAPPLPPCTAAATAADAAVAPPLPPRPDAAAKGAAAAADSSGQKPRPPFSLNTSSTPHPSPAPDGGSPKRPSLGGGSAG